ncbi:Amino oxidase domain-containing protein [Citrus sinensis]|uniref:Amino oxidase domain-containing protein n=1 Tax=Citrus sinensis TaxID=2711 RepID=A0ACB8I5P6_CITSI|nr:Amino oxidase domain-containing protein [Citrus sinensis]
MRVAVIGGGMSGLVSAYVLAKAGVEVVLYEKEDSLGGHAKTVTIDGVDLDIGFMLFNHVEYPNMMEFLESLGVDMGTSDMSFSVSLDKGQGYEWGTRNGLSSLFAQKKNVLNPYFWQMLREMMKFKDDVLSYVEELENNPDIDRNETLGHFIKSRGYSELFLKAYLIPICSSVWSCPSDGAMRFSAFSVLSFCRLFQLFGHPQCVTVRRHSHSQIDKVSEQLKSWGIQIRMSCEVYSVFPADEGCSIVCENGSQEFYNGCVMAVHAPDALRILGNQATFDETRILGAFRYVYRDVFLHRDKNFMPQNPAAWSAWNFVGSTNGKICLTYCLNVLQPLECLTLQKIGETSMPFLATLNPDRTPQNTLLKWSTGHSVPSVAASKASLELHRIQGKRGIWYSGVYQDWIHSYRLSLSTADVVVEYVKLQHQFTCHCSELLGYGFPEDGLKVGMIAAHGVLGKSCAILGNPKQMCAFWLYSLLEEGGKTFTFEGPRTNCPLKSDLRIQNPQFYWKVMTQADLGLANSYINGDLSFIDKDEGLLNLFLSNELFSLFLGKSMMYSCAIFKSEYEDLDVAQMRKVSLLIEKARVNKGLDVLEIGCGWGTLAIEIVKQTGCKYTGITLSEEQLKYTETKVKEAGLQDHIRLYLCDYRQMPEVKKYDTIISCEMIENVGHEYIEEFFGCCESLLAEHGLLLLQFSSVPDQCYDGHRLSPGFITEYVFPGGCLPSLNRITSAMTSSSRLW